MSAGTSTSRIKLHATFKTFADFYETYSNWIDENYHPFTVHKSHRSDDPKIKYVRVRYSCVHRGTPAYRGTGKRPNQTYMGKNCPAFISINYAKSVDALVINGFVDQHNHETGPEIYMAYRQNRKLSDKEVAKAVELIKSNTPAHIIAKTMADMTGKLVSKKDIYNLQSRVKQNSEFTLESETDGMSKSLPDEDTEVIEGAVISIISEDIGELEDEKMRKYGENNKRKLLRDSEIGSAVQSVLATAENDETSRDSTKHMETKPISLVRPPDADPVEVIITSAQTPKRFRKTNPAHPLGTKLNLIKLHEDGATDVQIFDVGELTGPEKPGPGVPRIEVKSPAGGKRGDLVFVKGIPALRTDGKIGSTTCGTSVDVMPTKLVSKKVIAMRKQKQLMDTLAVGLTRVCPAQQLNTIAQVCRSWRDSVHETLEKRNYPAWIMEHLYLTRESKVDDLLVGLNEHFSHLAFEPKVFLSFMSAALFRPQFGPADRSTHQVSHVKDILPKKTSLCEIYSVGIVGSTYSGEMNGQFQIIQAQESNVIGGISGLLLPNMPYAVPSILMLDGKRLLELESSDEMPDYVEESFGSSGPGLKTVMLFEHGSPSPIAVSKFFGHLLRAHPSGFACIGAEICQSKVDPSIHLTDNQWGPTVIAIGFRGDHVLSTSLYLPEEKTGDALAMATQLMEWRARLGETMSSLCTDVKFLHFCFSLYCDRDRAGNLFMDENNPNTQFAASFPDVPLLGIQASGHIYGYSISDDINRTVDEQNAAKTMLDHRNLHSTAFCIVSIPNT